jgi:small subunit ribosomal protein S27Ae
VLRLRGGGKKRKKKNYTTPKKNKHKHKKVCLFISFFSLVLTPLRFIFLQWLIHSYLSFLKFSLFFSVLTYPFQNKLAVLKFYKVDDNGKITRVRRECTAEQCGAGVFMASHHDRQYCGKCGLTYVFNKPDEQ